MDTRKLKQQQRAIDEQKEDDDSVDSPQTDVDSDSFIKRGGDSQGVARPCFCGKTRTKHDDELPNWICHQCWKLRMEKHYYQCGDIPPGCTNLMGDKYPLVCAQCAFVQHAAFQRVQEINDDSILQTIGVALDKIG